MTQPARHNGPPAAGSAQSLRTAAITFALFVVLTIAPGLASVEDPQAATPDVQSLGPQVGTRVPDFTLSDHKGQSRTLMSLMGPKGLMLVFIRSADW